MNKINELRAWATTLETMRDEVEAEYKAVASALEKGEKTTYPKAKDKANVVKPLRLRLSELAFTLALIQRGGFANGEVDHSLAQDFLRRVAERGIDVHGRKGLPRTLERIAELEAVEHSRAERERQRAAQEAQLEQQREQLRAEAVRALAKELREIQ
jgi:hypothetical protein